MKTTAIAGVLLTMVTAVALVSREPQRDPRLKGATRQPERNGWIMVHLEGEPSQIGFQHGYLLAPEIQDAQRVIRFNLEHDTKKDWEFFRKAAREMLWPKIEAEYRAELEGIAQGLTARNVKLDVWDITALNAWLEFPYYTSWYDKNSGGAAKTAVPERCSALVATGSYTADGRIVMGHNSWTGYAEGSRWYIIYDIAPARGHRILMDGFPGLIHSSDDFGMNDAGIMITETTISQFHGFDTNGIPEFERARKAMQYSESIDDFARIMTEGNNGGYANTWLVGDRKANEIGSLELGLKNVTLLRSKDGYFAGSNFPANEKLIREETNFPPDDMSVSANARRVRWDQLVSANKGRIDLAMIERFLSDHYDTFAKKEDPNERTLCGHIDLSPRGSKPWQPEYGIAGTVQAKVTDAAMAGRMSLFAAAGHSCGIHFKAAEHLKKHPEFSWQKPVLRDMDAKPWTEFRVH